MREKEEEKERDRWIDSERASVKGRKRKREGGGKGRVLAMTVFHTFAKVSQKLFFHFYVVLSKISDIFNITLSHAFDIPKTINKKKTK